MRYYILLPRSLFISCILSALGLKFDREEALLPDCELLNRATHTPRAPRRYNEGVRHTVSTRFEGPGRTRGITPLINGTLPQ